MSTCFADATRQGSAYVGEFRILREYSLVDAMTMKLRETRCGEDQSDPEDWLLTY